MKKLKFFLTLLLMAVGVGATWAQGTRITDLANLGNNKCYYLKAARGYLKGDLTATTDNNAGDGDRFALIKNVTGTYCIYNVQRAQFLTQNRTYVETADNTCTFNIQSSGASDLIRPTNPQATGGTVTQGCFVIYSTASNHNWLQIAGNNSLVINSWGQLDGGNQWAIEEVQDVTYDYDALVSRLTNVTDAHGNKIVGGTNYFMLLPIRTDNTRGHNYVLHGTTNASKYITLEHDDIYALPTSAIDNTYFWNLSLTAENSLPAYHVVKNVGHGKYISFSNYDNGANKALLSVAEAANAEKFTVQSTEVDQTTYWRLHITGGNNVFSNFGGASNGMGLYNSTSDTGGLLQFRPVAVVSVNIVDLENQPILDARWGVNGGEVNNTSGSYYFVRDISSINVSSISHNTNSLTYKLNGDDKSLVEVIEAINTATENINVTIVIAGEEKTHYNVRFEDEGGNTVAVEAQLATGSKAVAGDVLAVSTDATFTRFYGSQDFLVRNFVSATVGETTYPTWAAMVEAVNSSADVTVKLSAPALKVGRYYAIRHAGNTRKCIIENASNGLVRGDHNPTKSQNTIFTFEDAGEGKFYIRNIGTDRYVKRAGSVGENTAIPTEATITPGANHAYRITNAIIPGSPNIFVLADATVVPNPLTGTGVRYYLHTNQDPNGTDNIVRWTTNSTSGNNSHWTIEEIPTITLSYKKVVEENGEKNIEDVEDPENVGYTATNNGAGMPQGKVLSCFKGIAFDDYAVVEYKLNGEPYTTRTQFFEACHNLTADATAELTLRRKAAGEVDVTIELWKEKGKGYTYDDTGHSNAKTGNTWTDNVKEWILNEGGVDIKGQDIPDINFTITSSENTGVGGMISVAQNNQAHYHYGHVESNPWCICFQDVTTDHTGTTFTMSVNTNEEATQNYYILQYSIGGFPSTADDNLTMSNPSGGSVKFGDTNSGARQYNLTDTPADHTAEFTLTGPAAVAANYFRVRIVNQTYLENSMERGYAICSAALRDGVGYPKSLNENGEPLEEGAYHDLKAAINAYDALNGNTLDNYIAMLQAYSRYISCTDLNMPDDCEVYTLSFIKSDGSRVLINNGENGMETVAYTEANRAKPSARWISHENADGHLVFVNKKDGKYLQVTNTNTCVAVSETYDANTNSFIAKATTQDMSDYMASATDEKLLGAICLKNVADNCKLTINKNGQFAVKADGEFNENFTNAIRMERVDKGDTYNNVTFHKANDNKFYATYYGFYPVANPADADMYYMTGTKIDNDGTYLRLQQVTKGVIKPEFPVILISENMAYETKPDTHLHIGEYTTELKNDIDDLLSDKRNYLQGSRYDMRIDEAKALDDNGEPTLNGQVYVLSGGSNGRNVVGFYKYEYEYIPAGKAYYVHPNSNNSDENGQSNIRGFLFTTDDGQETRIDFVNDDVINNDGVIYDMSGRRVSKPTHGVFIVNGKKVLM